MKKLLFTALLATQLNAQANDDINYNYFELGYDYLDLSESRHADGFYLDGSFDLTDSFYMGGYYTSLSGRGADIDRYGLNFGAHTDISNKTDFYGHLKLGQIDTRFYDSFTYGAEFGTRTAFNERFELITLAGFTQIDDISDGFYELGVKGLFKFSDTQGITAGVKSLDGDFGAELGYRFSF